jgi:uncharacterized membrane protein
MTYSILAYAQAAFYIFAGVSHFRNPRFFVKMVPPAIPSPKMMVDLTGLGEIIIGLAFILPISRPFAALAAILLLVAVFPANVYMLTSDKFKRIPKWFLILRLPLQGVLIYWAYIFLM